MTQQRWRLDGQTALITGASAGIGLAIAHELAGFGADLMIVGRDIDMLETARDELLDVYPQMQVHALAADVSDDEDRRQITDWVEDHSDGLHITVNNAGGNVTKAATEYSEDEWRKIFETNLFSAFELSRYAHPLLARHASSSIVNVGSVSGLTHVRSGVVYGMTKAAMHQMTRNLAVEWAEDGIRVNAVAPWYIRTRRTSGPLSDPDYYEEVIDRTPMRRIGEPEEVAAAVGFLCLRQPATLPASASRWTAASCATGSDLRKGSAGRWPATTGYSVDCSCRPAAGTTGRRSPRHRAVAGLQHTLQPLAVLARAVAVLGRGEALPAAGIAEALLPAPQRCASGSASH